MAQFVGKRRRVVGGMYCLRGSIGSDRHRDLPRHLIRVLCCINIEIEKHRVIYCRPPSCPLLLLIVICLRKLHCNTFRTALIFWKRKFRVCEFN